MEIIWKNIREFTTEIKKDSHFREKKYKTNVKGIEKVEWWSPPFCECSRCKPGGEFYMSGGNCCLVVTSYSIKRVNLKGKVSHYGFDTKSEAEAYYLKHLKDKNITKIFKPKREKFGRMSVSKDEIERYVQKKGVLKKGYDVEIVKT